MTGETNGSLDGNTKIGSSSDDNDVYFNPTTPIINQLMKILRLKMANSAAFNPFSWFILLP